MSKPREFWIDCEEKHFPCNAYSELIHSWDAKQFIHVIEYSAYKELEEKCKELEEKRKELVEALKYLLRETLKGFLK